MSLHFNTRNTLLQKVKNQYDESAWQDFCAYYAPYIRLLLRRLNASEADAADISQAVILQLWKDLPGFEYSSDKGRFRSWLAIAVRNKAFTHFNKTSALQKKHEHFHASLLNEKSQGEFDELVEDEWQTYMTRLAWETISKSFSEDTLKVFKLTLAGKSNKEIALSEDLKENTVAAYKKRVQVALHKEIIKLNDELS